LLWREELSHRKRFQKEIVSVLFKKFREPKLERLLTIKIYR